MRPETWRTKRRKRCGGGQQPREYSEHGFHRAGIT
jgi:hypothetical protein